MKKFISHHINTNEKDFNFPLINRDYDDDLIYHLINSCKSLEILPNIKFLGFDHITDESKIDINNYIKSRKAPKKNSEIKYMYIEETRQSELHVKFQITCNDESEVITKKILLPTKDKNGFFTIKGTKYFLMFQTVESSTYNSKNSLILKSLMPVAIKRTKKKYEDIDGIEYNAPTYGITVFKKEVDIFLFYFSKKGVSKTLEYFNIEDVITIIDSSNEKIDKDNYIYFSISNKIYIKIIRELFEKYQYVKSVVFMILNVTTNRFTISNMDNREFWTEKLGGVNSTSIHSYEKGKSLLIFFDRLLDESTKNILKIHNINKKSVYAIVRWMIQNFNELRKKDNLSLENKRLRCNEYIASLLTKEFSERINNPISSGNKLNLDKLKKIFKFPGDIIFLKLHKSILMQYDDTVNDQNFWTKLKVTQKGPQSLGNKNKKNISKKYKGVHPSQVGRFDINVCGSTDPGSSGLLTPFCKTHGLYFNKDNEPENFIKDFRKDVIEYKKSVNSNVVLLNVKLDENYYDNIEKIKNDFNNHKISIKKMEQNDKTIIRVENISS